MNYIEYIAYIPDNGPDNGVNINIPITLAEKWVHVMRKRGFKHFSKQFKTYVHNDMYMENTDHTDIKVYSLCMSGFSVIDCTKTQMVKVEYIKDKQAFHAFPSTTSHDSIFYTKRLTFRVHNRLFVNFDTQFYPDDESTINKVFINYNHEVGMDSDVIQLTLDTILPIFKSI
jgi:hypothetical protein